MRIEGLDVIVPTGRDQDAVFLEQALCLFPGQDGLVQVLCLRLLRRAEVTAVMDESQMVRLQVFPGPVETGQFTEVRILSRDIVPGVVFQETEVDGVPVGVFIAGRAHLYRDIDRVVRHAVLLVRSDDDLSCHRISPKGIACLSKRQSEVLPEAMDRSISNCWTRRRTFFLSSRKFCPKGLMMTPNRLSAARLELRML